MLPKFGIPMRGSGLGMNAPVYADLMRLPPNQGYQGFRPTPVVQNPTQPAPFIQSTPQHNMFGDYSGSDASAGADRGGQGPESAESIGDPGSVTGRGAVQGLLDTVSPVSPTAWALSKAIDATMGPDPYGGLGFSPAAISTAMSQMDNQTAENETNNDGFGRQGNDPEAPGMGGDTSGRDSGPADGGGPDGPDGPGWKKGGAIKNVRGLLDDPKKQEPNAKTHRGLLDGPEVDYDNLKATNVKTGEDIKVQSGEYVIPVHVVKAKGKKFFDNLLKEYDV